MDKKMPAFAVKPKANGRFEFAIFDEERKVTAGIDMPNEEGAQLAGAALFAAQKAAADAGLSPSPQAKTVAIHMFPDSVGLMESPRPDTVALVATFGLSNLGILLTTEQARKIGTALLAASADGTARPS